MHDAPDTDIEYFSAFSSLLVQVSRMFGLIISCDDRLIDTGSDTSTLIYVISRLDTGA